MDQDAFAYSFNFKNLESRDLHFLEAFLAGSVIHRNRAPAFAGPVPPRILDIAYPASLWSQSERRYNPVPPPWEYPQDAWVLKVDCQGTVDLHGCRYRIGKTLAGERVMIQPLEQRLLVFFCCTLVREIDPAMQRSTIVERCIETPV